MPETSRFGVSMPLKLLKQLDAMVERKGFPNRSELIRELVRDFIVQQEWIEGGDIVGTITVIYDHHSRELMRTLSSFQHSQCAMVLSNLHIHLDEHNCLEVIVIKGRSKEVQRFADTVLSTKGVKHGKMVYTAATRPEHD